MEKLVMEEEEEEALEGAERSFNYSAAPG